MTEKLKMIIEDIPKIDHFIRNVHPYSDGYRKCDSNLQEFNETSLDDAKVLIELILLDPANSDNAFAEKKLEDIYCMFMTFVPDKVFTTAILD